MGTIQAVSYTHLDVYKRQLGYHMKEIAALLAISEDAAYKRLQRARNMLAQIWDREGERS